jgi:RNA polymerase sigma-70 factor, ECF subfamily
VSPFRYLLVLVGNIVVDRAGNLALGSPGSSRSRAALACESETAAQCVLPLGAAIPVIPETAAQAHAPDAALVRRILKRDEAALGELYDRYAGLLTAVLVRILRDTQAAEEILQDVFHQLWRSAGQFDESRGSLPGWLMVIARNRAISRLRKHNPAAGEELFEGAMPLAFNLETATAQQEMLGRVRGVMQTLPPEQRAAVELAYFEGMSHSEIAARTGDPLGTVKTRLRTAMETLRRTLQP